MSCPPNARRKPGQASENFKFAWRLAVWLLLAPGGQAAAPEPAPPVSSVAEAPAEARNGPPLPLRYAFWGLGLATGGALLALSWGFLLRRKVRQQTELIRRKLLQEAALEQSYRDLVENASDIIFELDLRGNFLALNRAAEMLSGYTREEVLNQNFVDFLLPGQVQPARERLARVLAGEKSFLHEWEIRSKTGEWLPLEVVVRLVTKDGAPHGFQGIARDIRRRLQAEEKLRKLSRAVEQSPAAITITNLDGQIEYVNPKFLAISGYALEEVIGKTPRILKSGHTPAEEYERLWKTITTGREWQGEFLNRKKNGEMFWESAYISPITDAAGDITHYVAVKEDITARRQLEGQLRQSQKMESIGQLAAGIAHDYNNLLTVILGHSSLLKNEPDLPAAAREFAMEISQAAEKASNLTRQLLVFSRRQRIQPRVASLNNVIANLGKMLVRLLGEHITVVFDYGQPLPPVLADEGMLEQVLINLAVNARDAMPKGGELNIRTRLVEVDAPHLQRNPEAQPGPHVCLTVADQGCGMDEATQERIFEPFFTTKSPGKGTGLGLSTVFGIVKQHRGWIEVTSEVNQGATFQIFLPPTRQVPEPPTERLEKSPSGSETILFVEDEEALRKLGRNVLTRAGYQVLEAPCGPDAIKIWEQNREKVDALITDMVMPGGMSGYDLAVKLVAEKPSLKVLVVSGYSAALATLDENHSQQFAVLQKPFSPKILVQTLRDCLDGTRPLRPAGSGVRGH